MASLSGQCAGIFQAFPPAVPSIRKPYHPRAFQEYLLIPFIMGDRLMSRRSGTRVTDRNGSKGCPIQLNFVHVPGSFPFGLFDASRRTRRSINGGAHVFCLLGNPMPPTKAGSNVQSFSLLSFRQTHLVSFVNSLPLIFFPNNVLLWLPFVLLRPFVPNDCPSRYLSRATRSMKACRC